LAPKAFLAAQPALKTTPPINAFSSEDPLNL
jgi:hypothetical protein